MVVARGGVGVACWLLEGGVVVGRGGWGGGGVVAKGGLVVAKGGLVVAW